jgi:hypothetical protein
VSNNLKKWDQWSQPPAIALKPFKNGTFSGTDINPMWRIKVLTQTYGEVGFGWYFTIDKQWMETCHKSDTMKCFVIVSLYVKQDDEWSKPIQGTGGNEFSGTVKEKKDYKTDKVTRPAYQKTSDECYKMATTDALGSACKCLGIGAAIYWEKGSKYTMEQEYDEFIALDEVGYATQTQIDELKEYMKVAKKLDYITRVKEANTIEYINQMSEKAVNSIITKFMEADVLEAVAKKED